MSVQQQYKLVFFTPPQTLAPIKDAIFATGAGTVGNYSQVAFTTPGVGQFQANEGASPVMGDIGKVLEVGEVRCEIACAGEQVAREAVTALKK